MRILISAYSCVPGEGSEAGVGWNMAREMATDHEIWVLTRANNRAAVEAELARHPVPNLHFAYYDLPRWTRWWKRGRRGVQPYYYLWQLGVYARASRLHGEIGFELIHHLTFGKCWAPSCLSLLPVPFIWGPVGGGESAPRTFWRDLGPRGFAFESVREAARWMASFDPLVRLTARRSRLVLAKTDDTARWVQKVGTRSIQICSESALSQKDLDNLAAIGPVEGGIRFISIGNLLHLKGFHLGLRAFALSGLTRAEYWIVGDGPERRRLEVMARRLGVFDRTVFWGQVPRANVLAHLRTANVLVHPSLHDSGGWVCLEAMAASKPVICLDLGGPAGQVTAHTGIKVAAISPSQAVRDMAAAMVALANDPARRSRMGRAGRERVLAEYVWERRRDTLNMHYRAAVGASALRELAPNT